VSVGMVGRALAAVVLLAIGPVQTSHSAAPVRWRDSGAADTTFAARVARLSEPGGFFDSDNLVSNEKSYLHVLGRLRTLGVSGGAYVGVGPDQNFSYLVHVKPRVALIVDIRRDNLLMQLLYKSMFELAPTRVEFLSLLFGRAAPVNPASFVAARPDELLDWVADVPFDSARAATVHQRVMATVRGFGVPLDDRDVRTMSRFHDEFIANGPELRYASLGRPPRAMYPTYRDLVLERDLDGRESSFLAREEDYRWLRNLQRRNLVIPVVGNLAGDRAMPAIARFLRERGDSLSVFYTSNVEQYLMRDGLFARWAENLLRFPRTSRSVVIRSYFGRQWNGPHPNTQAGYFSTQLVQRVDAFASEWEKGTLVDYWAVVTQGIEKP